jgi:hypothetical protein
VVCHRASDLWILRGRAAQAARHPSRFLPRGGHGRRGAVAGSGHGY